MKEWKETNTVNVHQMKMWCEINLKLMTFAENYSQATKQTAIYKDVAKSKRHLQDTLA